MIQWADGFDHYGSVSASALVKMVAGAWAEVTGQITLSSTNPRTGTYHLHGSVTTANRGARRIYSGALTTVGQCGSYYLSNLPTVAGSLGFMQFRDTNNANQMSIVCGTTGTIEVRRGPTDGTVVATSSSTPITAGNYLHIETKIFMSQTVGTVDVYVDGNLVVSYTGDTCNTVLVETSQVMLICSDKSGGWGGATTVDLDDVYAWDTTGVYNNDVMGDYKVLRYGYDADTAEADWTPLSGTGVSNIDDNPGPDDDTTYNSAANSGDVSEYETEAVPSTITVIAGIVLVNHMKATGTANVTAASVSGASATSGTDRTMTATYAYYHDVIERNPDGGGAWTYATLSASKLRLTRTA